jgi:hypothetical protein
MCIYVWQALEGRVHNVREIVTGVFTFIGLGLAALSVFLVMEEVREVIQTDFRYSSVGGVLQTCIHLYRTRAPALSIFLVMEEVRLRPSHYSTVQVSSEDRLI